MFPTHLIKSLHTSIRRFKNRSKRIELSYSRVQAYLRCPWMYHLIYDCGWRSGPTAPMAFGQSLHKTLAEYFSDSNKAKTLDRLLEIYDQMWVNEGYSSTQDTLDAYDRGRKILEQFFTLDKDRQSTVVATEKDFQTVLGDGLVFRGTIDRLDRYPDGRYEIVEYKSVGEPWTESRMESDLQMTLYSYGVAKALAIPPPYLRFVFLSSGKSIGTKRSDQQKKDAEKLLTSVADKIRIQDFTPNPAYCVHCEFGPRCVNYKKPAIENHKRRA